MPEFTVTILLLVYGPTLGFSCMYNVSCMESIDIAQAFNIVSMGFQFFVFKRFDKNFCKSLENILENAFLCDLNKQI